MMENDILDALQDIGYEGTLKEEIALVKALEGGAKSLEFTKLVAELAGELRQLCDFEEAVNATNDPEEASTFLLELSSFLKELGCPYISMVTGHLSSRLQTRQDRLLLLDYLLSELMAARMINLQKPKDKIESMEITIQESPTAKDLKEILIQLGVNKPPPNITAEMLTSKIEEKLKEALQKKGALYVGRPLYNKALTEKQWKELDTLFSEIYDEFKMRREMLITRLDCTIRSFEWSDRTRAKRDQIQKAYQPHREALKIHPDIRFCDFLAARDTLLHVEKTSSANVRKNTRSQVNKVIIGRVPDRGGRSWEQKPPPPEMPSWTQQRSQGPGGGGSCGRGGGFGGRGGGRDGNGGFNAGGSGRGAGRVQGGWNQQGNGDNRFQSAGGSYSRSNSQSQPYQGGHQSYQSQSQPHQSNQSPQSQGYQTSGHSQGYTPNQAYSGERQGYQSHGQPYQGQTHGYQHQPQGRGGYQNEHDDRTGGGQSRPASGRSNYGRGGHY